MRVPKARTLVTSVTAMTVLGVGLILNPVFATVSPPSTDDTLAPGESVVYEKTVTLPEFPPKLDVCFLVDVSGSYFDDLPNIRTQMSAVWDIVKDEIDDSQWCVTSFRDFPFSPWGSTGDFAYRLNQDLSPNKTDFTDALDLLVAGGGNDGPESQYEALYEMATGAGNDVPPAGPSLGDVPPGQDPSWRADATKVLIITTDAPFHNAGDPGPFPYPGPSSTDTIDALVAAGIKVIALKAPGATAQMDALAAATGGSVQATTSTSNDIGEAILDAFEALTFDVTGVPVGCDELDISLDPASYEDVPGGESVVFDETIAVPDDIMDIDNPYCCSVVFSADDTEVGTQTVCVTVQRSVDVDIKPGSFPNSINLRRDTGVIPVAILGSEEFDVTDIDVTTLTFGPGEQVPAHDPAGHYEDVNEDGFMDLVSHYVVGGTGIASGDTEACISGKTNDGIDFLGCDSVRTIH